MPYTVKELKMFLDKFEDDDLVLIEGQYDNTTHISEINDSRYLSKVKKSFETFECEDYNWDSTPKFKNAKRCCLITSEAYYL